MPSPVAARGVALRHESGARAEVRLHGAHVTSWRTEDSVERLFLSSASRFEPGVPIRGGIPVIFPQFADRGPLPKHGFARLLPWRLLEGGDGEPRCVLGLDDSPPTRAAWPFAFRAELAVELGARRLAVELRVHAVDALEFTAALHSYLRVENVERTRIRGLRGRRFESGVEGVRDGREERDVVRPAGELDRVYLDVEDPLLIEDEAATGARLEVAADGFPDVVLWNPGAEKGRALGDLGAGEERRMLCVEAAAVGRPVRVDAGGTWRGSQFLRVA